MRKSASLAVVKDVIAGEALLQDVGVPAWEWAANLG
jgi:hypothetical protein